jgi:hypothetical protein
MDSIEPRWQQYGSGTIANSGGIAHGSVTWVVKSPGATITLTCTNIDKVTAGKRTAINHGFSTITHHPSPITHQVILRIALAYLTQYLKPKRLQNYTSSLAVRHQPACLTA